MPRTSTLQGNFSRGEVSPLALGRPDFEGWQRGARRLENWIVLKEGGLQKAPGTRYISTAGDPTQAVVLVPFVFRTTDALMLEFGHAYLRFYKHTAPVLAGMSPYEIVTPYQAADLFQLRFEQKNDVVYITHVGYAPRRLIRLADDDWQLSTVASYPPPTAEGGLQAAIALALGATSGSAVSCTAASALFLRADVDRELTSGAGRAIVTGYTSPTVVALNILDAFSSTTIAANDWMLHGSPVANCKPSKAGPAGAAVTLSLRQIQDEAPNLVVEGTFPDLSSWTDLSGPQLASGTHDGAADDDFLDDSTADFVAAGVQETMRVINTTDGCEGIINGVYTSRLTVVELNGGTDNDFDIGDAYTVSKSGSARPVNNTALLHGGPSGVGWIEQSLATVANTAYRMTFEVREAPLSVMVGDASMGSDRVAETTYPLGKDHVVVFDALDASTFVGFRNNQNYEAAVANVACRVYGVDGWRLEDVGDYVYLNGGLVRITAFTSARVVQGQILQALTTDAEAAAGSWSLEEPAWSAVHGYPRRAKFHEQRLLYASSPTFPQTIWGSTTGGFEDFTRAPEADASFTYTMANAKGPLLWLESVGKLLVGAESNEIRFGTPGAALSAVEAPEDYPAGDAGSGEVDPLRIGSAVLFCQRMGSKLRELLFDDTVQNYVASDLTQLSGHLLSPTVRIVQLAYAAEPVPIVWAARSDGTLLGLTYDREDKVLAWFRRVTPDGVIESVAVIPHPTRNAYQVWVVVRRWSGSDETRHIEVFDDVAQGVDACVVYDGGSTTTLTGLAHLEGQSVAVAGIVTGTTTWQVFPAQVVSGGAITLPQAVTQAYAGLAWVAEGETLSPELPGAPTLQVLKKRWVTVTTRVHESGEGLSINGRQMVFRTVNDALDVGVPLFTGDVSGTNFGWGKDGTLVFRHDLPLPCTLLFVGGLLEIGDAP